MPRKVALIPIRYIDFVFHFTGLGILVFSMDRGRWAFMWRGRLGLATTAT